MNQGAQFSILTGQGQSGIAVLALRGINARKTAAQIFQASRPQNIASAPEGALIYGRVHENEEQIDEALLAIRRAGAVWQVEINCHGGTVAVRKAAGALERLSLIHI